MARFHLPFATSEETIVRSISFHLLRQYLELKKGHRPDMDLAELDEQYKKIEKVNLGILGRIRTTSLSGDSDANAIIHLHSFTTLLEMAMANHLTKLEPLFLVR